MKNAQSPLPHIALTIILLSGVQPCLAADDAPPTPAASAAVGAPRWVDYPDNPVLAPGPAGSFDAGALGTMNVLKVGKIFHMYYEAWGVRSGKSDNWSEFTSLQIGHATSADGIHWQKDPANPVLPKGSGDDWDRDGTWDPFVMYENGVFKMWYGGGQQHCDWGYAVSTDGVHFVKKGRISQIGQVEDDHVVHDPASGHYFMYYRDRVHAPYGLPYRAESTDETHFDFAGAKMIEIAGLPDKGCYKFPHVFQEGGLWHMYFCKYVGPNCKNCWTGYATSQDGRHWQVRNPKVLLGHDAYVVKVAGNLHFLYYGRPGHYDQKDCDIRLAVLKGNLTDLAETQPVKQP